MQLVNIYCGLDTNGADIDARKVKLSPLNISQMVTQLLMLTADGLAKLVLSTSQL